MTTPYTGPELAEIRAIEEVDGEGVYGCVSAMVINVLLIAGLTFLYLVAARHFGWRP